MSARKPTLAQSLKRLGGSIVSFWTSAESIDLRIGLTVAEAESLIVAAGSRTTTTLVGFLAEYLPGAVRPNKKGEMVLNSLDNRHYRMVQAGRVGRIVGLTAEDESLPSIGALFLLHRYLKVKEWTADQSREAITAVWAAADGTIAGVETAMAELYPDVQGSRGPSGNGKKGKKNETEEAIDGAAMQAALEDLTSMIIDKVADESKPLFVAALRIGFQVGSDRGYANAAAAVQALVKKYGKRATAKIAQ